MSGTKPNSAARDNVRPSDTAALSGANTRTRPSNSSLSPFVRVLVVNSEESAARRRPYSATA